MNHLLTHALPHNVDFLKYDIQKRGELDEHEAAMLLEARKATKTASEIRAMISKMDADKNHRISFIEWYSFTILFI